MDKKSLLMNALRAGTPAFTIAELDGLIEREFTDSSKVMDVELIDAAILRRTLLLGEDTTPEGLQMQYTKIAYKYLRYSLGLPE